MDSKDCNDSVDIDVNEGDITYTLCPRAVGLQNRLKQVVLDALNNVSEDDFITAYKTCYEGFQKKDEIVRPSLAGSSIEAKKYRAYINSSFTDSMNDVIESGVASMNSKIAALEELKESQSIDDISPTWRPPGDAIKHMEPFDYAAKVEELKALQVKAEADSDEINLLKSRLTQKRMKAKELHEKVNSSLQNLESCMSTRNEIPVPDE